MEAVLEFLTGVGHVVLLVLVFVVQAAGALSLFVAMPGTWIILGSIVFYGVLTGFASFGWGLILALAALGVLGEVLEFLASAVGAQRYGASRGGVICAVIGVIPGVILGSILLPVIGTLVGAFAGAFLGAVLWELGQRRPRDEAIRAGLGALLGRTGGLVVKLLIAITMSGAFIAALLGVSG